jgi:Intracellular proteinase inhibitor
MRVILPLLFSGLILLAGCSSSNSDTTADEPGLLGRMWGSTRKLNPFDRELKPRELKERKPLKLKSLVAHVSVDPSAPKLGEQRQMAVTLRLTNKGKRLAQLEFSTTQRVEGVIRDRLGNVIERWSDDQRFERESGVVSINPGERVEYTLNLATREMSAGETYSAEALVVGYESLHGSASVTPLR